MCERRFLWVCRSGGGNVAMFLGLFCFCEIGRNVSLRIKMGDMCVNYFVFYNVIFLNVVYGFEIKGIF